MEIKKKDKLDIEKYGLFTGLIVPLIAIFFIYLYISPDSLNLFLRQIFIAGLYNKLIGLSIVPNFLVYFYFRWKSKLKFAEGISIASLIYLIIIVILRYAT